MSQSCSVCGKPIAWGFRGSLPEEPSEHICENCSTLLSDLSTFSQQRNPMYMQARNRLYALATSEANGIARHVCLQQIAQCDARYRTVDEPKAPVPPVLPTPPEKTPVEAETDADPLPRTDASETDKSVLRADTGGKQSESTSTSVPTEAVSHVMRAVIGISVLLSLMSLGKMLNIPIFGFGSLIGRSSSSAYSLWEIGLIAGKLDSGIFSFGIDSSDYPALGFVSFLAILLAAIVLIAFVAAIVSASRGELKAVPQLRTASLLMFGVLCLFLLIAIVSNISYNADGISGLAEGIITPTFLMIAAMAASAVTAFVGYKELQYRHADALQETQPKNAMKLYDALEDYKDASARSKELHQKQSVPAAPASEQDEPRA